MDEVYTSGCNVDQQHPLECNVLRGRSARGAVGCGSWRHSPIPCAIPFQADRQGASRRHPLRIADPQRCSRGQPGAWDHGGVRGRAQRRGRGCASAPLPRCHPAARSHFVPVKGSANPQKTPLHGLVPRVRRRAPAIRARIGRKSFRIFPAIRIILSGDAAVPRANGPAASRPACFPLCQPGPAPVC